MKKTLITYSLAGRKNALEITRQIYGYKDHSNHGRYTYKRKGILTNIPYQKISRTTFWINPKYKQEIIQQFQKLKLKIKVFDITIKNND